MKVLLLLTLVSLVLGQARFSIYRNFQPNYAYYSQDPYVRYTFTGSSTPIPGYMSTMTHFKDLQIAGLAEDGVTYAGECGRSGVIGSITWSYSLTSGLSIDSTQLLFQSASWVCFEFRILRTDTWAHYGTAFTYNTHYELTNSLPKTPPFLSSSGNKFDAWSTPEQNGPGPGN